MYKSQQRVLDRRVLYPGDVLIREGEHGDCAFFIQSGQVGVYKRSGNEEVLITVLPGNSIVGEMALIDNAKRSATVRCIETATVISINRDAFEKKLYSIDPFMKALLEMFVQKLRRLNSEYCEAETKLQWVLRASGLGAKLATLGPATPAQRKASPPPPPADVAPIPEPPPKSAPFAEDKAKPGPDEAEEPLPDRFDINMDDQSLNKFNALKLELALLYHPQCRGNHPQQTLSRAEVFHEIWTLLESIEHDPDIPD